MAYNTEDVSPRLLKVNGAYTEIAAGIDDSTGTTLTVTIPNFTSVHGVVANSLDSTTMPILATTTGNVFTMTCASNDTISWMAWGIAKI